MQPPPPRVRMAQRLSEEDAAGWDKAGSLDWVGGGWAFYLQGIWAELQQEARGPDDNFIFQGALNWDASDLFQVSISFSFFSL